MELKRYRLEIDVTAEGAPMTVTADQGGPWVHLDQAEARIAEEAERRREAEARWSRALDELQKVHAEMMDARDDFDEALDEAHNDLSHMNDERDHWIEQHKRATDDAEFARSRQKAAEEVRDQADRQRRKAEDDADALGNALTRLRRETANQLEIMTAAAGEAKRLQRIAQAENARLVVENRDLRRELRGILGDFEPRTWRDGEIRVLTARPLGDGLEINVQMEDPPEVGDLVEIPDCRAMTSDVYDPKPRARYRVASRFATPANAALAWTLILMPSACLGDCLRGTPEAP